eukprot:Unigene11669_Nuclearia_a/m.35544 Unigene11669_Nuclearia_a/g.35544  ORF Unigene11669_Nuclearia_a/g.35544 Unigene11669_Nuclearia_a/m.35544 type:complete len:115 (+) Unigene11669_Nuclearia_a:1-345(+)
MQLRRVYLRALQDADVAAWIRGKHEVVCVDLMLRLQEELRTPSSVQFLGEQGVQALKAHIETIIQALPADLSQSILTPPHEKLMETAVSDDLLSVPSLGAADDSLHSTGVADDA